MKLFEKAKALDVAELNKLADVMLPKIYTNIESKEILESLTEIAKYKIKENIGWPYKTRGATIGGIWYGPAVTLESNVTKLHQEIYGQVDYVPSSVMKKSNYMLKHTTYNLYNKHADKTDVLVARTMGLLILVIVF